MMSISTEHIAKIPGICGGRACIAGTRIRVMDVVVWHVNQGRSLEQIVKDFPHISLADVHAAMAYYHDHRDEIEHEFEKDRQMDEFGRTQPSPLKDFLTKLSGSGEVLRG